MGVCAVLMAMVAASGLPAWNFDVPEEVQAWQFNGHLADVKVRDGVLYATGIDWDPFFTNSTVSFEATPYQYVRIRIKADKPGTGELFWTGQTSGANGGFDGEKRTPFLVAGDNEWHEVVLFPGWHGEGTVRQLRLDVYEGATFAIDSVVIGSWAEGAVPDASPGEWTLDPTGAPWIEVPGADARFAPPLRVSAAEKGWAAVTVSAEKEGGAALLWSDAKAPGLQTEEFVLRGDGQTHTYNLEMAGNPAWKEVVALGVRLPEGARLESVKLSDEPAGPAELDVAYFGFENAVNRAGRECSVLAQLTNRGGASADGLKLRLEAPAGVRIVGEAEQEIARLDYSDQAERTWRVAADAPGTYPFKVFVENGAKSTTSTANFAFTPAVEVTKADYVPEPRPVETAAEVLAYYFPGWESDAKWDCIRRVAPVRKPLLGYYDESNPECVDWQIKWARENGISCFLVDWYWSAGNQHLRHWFEAYRQARYRDQLMVAIMWANHNAPNTHSREDWRSVVKEWIDKYFNLPGYYHIDGKPAIFFWAPDNLRRDLGSPAEVRAAMDEAQQIARAAGYEGITFVAMQAPRGEAHMKGLRDEGYAGATSYHEWGSAEALAPQPKLWRYEDLVETAPSMWRTYRRLANDTGMIYFPVVDTGWDARPWHGNKSHVIAGRTPERFERLMNEAKEFIANDERPTVILAPVNEWGEGSYIEPALEYDFGMYEAIRRVFGKGDPATWPVNVAPSDVGRGPYDYPSRPVKTSWAWEDGAEGWQALMGVQNLRVEDKTLRFSTDSSDPALTVNTPGLRASDVVAFEVRMRLTAPNTAETPAQLFWSRGGSTNEAASVHLKVVADGQSHTYTADLSGHPRWRGPISSLRFDPCDAPNADVVIEEIRLVERPAN